MDTNTTTPRPNNEQSSAPKDVSDARRIARLEAEIDQRDEIIRQLNEALSLALDELNLPRAA